MMGDGRVFMLGGAALGALGVAVWMFRTRTMLRESGREVGGTRGVGRVGGVGGIEAPVWLVAALLMFIAPVFGASIGVSLPPAVVGPKDSLQQSAVQQLLGYGSAMVVGGLLLGLMKRGLLSRDGAASLGRLGFAARPRDAVTGVVGLVMVAPVYVLVNEGAAWAERVLRGGEATETIKHTTLKKLVESFSAGSGQERAWAWVVIAGVVLLVPVIEEVMYRGFLQSFFVRVIGNNRLLAAVAVNSAIFALMHVATGVVPWSAGAALFVLSMGLGIAFERTGRLGTPIVMHALFNAVNVAAAVWG